MKDGKINGSTNRAGPNYFHKRVLPYDGSVDPSFSRPIFAEPDKRDGSFCQIIP